MRGLASLRSEGGHLPAGMVVSMGQHDAQFQQHTQLSSRCGQSVKFRATLVLRAKIAVEKPSALFLFEVRSGDGVC